MSIDPNLCKHNIVNDNKCMFCGTRITKTQAKVNEAIAQIDQKRQEPGYVSPLRSEANAGNTTTRTFPDSTSL